MTIGIIFSFNLLMLLMCIVFSAYKSSREINNAFLIILVLAVSIYTLQRDFDYGDTLNYINFYLYDHSYLKFEPVFDFLARIFIQIFPSDPSYFLFFCASLTTLLLFLAYRNFVGIKSSYLVYWILLTTYSFHYFLFEVIRQGIAISLLMLGLSYMVKNGNWLKYYFCLILGIGFHYSLLPFVLLPLLLLINRTYYYYLIFIFFGILGSFLILKIGNFIGLSDITHKIEIYSEMSSESHTILLRNLMLIVVTPLVYKISNSRVFFNFYFLYVVLLAMSIGFDEINRRYLFVGPIFLIPVLWNYLKNKKNGALFFLIYMFIYFYVFLINYWSMYSLLNYTPLFELI